MKRYIRSTTTELSDSEDFIVRRTPEQEEAYGKWLDHKLLYPISKYASKDEQKRRKIERKRLRNEYLATLNRSDDVKSNIICAADITNQMWYRCVPKGTDPESFNDYELGIHCGSKEQAEEICSTKYHGNCDIYRLELNPDVTFSNPVSDFDAWYSVEAIAEILSDGFNVPTSISEVAQAYRAGEWDKSSAGQYIIQTTGLIYPVVVYDNAVELSEQDIIILDPGSIQYIEPVNDVKASSKLFASVDTDPALTSKRIEYIYECLDNAPEVPTVDADDAPEAWSAYYHDAIDYKMWCFADAVEDGLFEEDDWDEFKRLWDKGISGLAVPWS